MSKTTIAVDRGVASRLSRIARAHGFNVFRLASELMGSTLDILEDGVTPRDISIYWKVYRAISVFDPVPVPASLLLELLRHVDQATAASMFREWGTRVGNTLKALVALEDVLAALPTITKFYLSAKAHCEFDDEGRACRVTVMGPPGSEQFSDVFREFVLGVLEAYGARGRVEARGNVLRLDLERE